jgi:ATP-dependent exoDNAse (exonuclease V) beta subunit
MLDTYLQCPAKFKAQYIDHSVPHSESYALKFGSALHLAFKSHFEDGNAIETFKMYWGSVKDTLPDLERYTWDDLGQMATKTFIPNFIKLHAKKIQFPILEDMVEMPFLGSHTLQGTFDVACQYEDKLTILDYKTSSSEYKKDKILRNPQMYIYAKLYEYKYGELPEQLVYKVFVKQDQRIQTLKLDVDKARVDKVMSNVETIAKDMLYRIESGNWYCNHNNLFCLTKEGCL